MWGIAQKEALCLAEGSGSGRAVGRGVQDVCVRSSSAEHEMLTVPLCAPSCPCRSLGAHTLPAGMTSPQSACSTTLLCGMMGPTKDTGEG